MDLLFISLAPVLIILFYIYFRDKYEKEPIKLLIKALCAGAFSVLPIIFVEQHFNEIDIASSFQPAFYNAFVVAAFSEETFKYLMVILLFFESQHFNEKFDGIVYSVFVSLGFALVENILYVYGENSMQVGWTRAFTAVPAHAVFGVIMGFHLGLAKFGNKNKLLQMFLALAFPILLHGIYDWILMSEETWTLALFFPFVIFLWIFALNRIKKHSKNSFFKN